MKSLQHFFLTFLMFCATTFLKAQNITELNNAIANKDYNSIVSYASQNKELEPRATDALCTVCNMDELNYEELYKLSQLTNSESNIGKLINHSLENKQVDIMESLNTMTVEEISDYCQQHPTRKDIVNRYLDNSIVPSLPSLSYLELNYLSTELPDFNKKTIKSEISKRSQEKKELLANNVSKFLKGESKSLPQIQYVMEKTVWSFFIEGHSQLTGQYSQIPMVPDNASAAANQYQSLVRICLAPRVLQNILQKEVNNYCEQVNKARKDYALIAGIKDYPKLSYTVPAIRLPGNISYSPLCKISEDRRQFIQARQNVSQTSGVLGWITGGLWGLGAKAIGDWMCISSLVDCEYESRKKYIDIVLNALYSSFMNYAQNSASNLKTVVIKNEQQYEKCLKQ